MRARVRACVGHDSWTAIDYIGESAIGSSSTAPDLQSTEGGWMMTNQPWQWCDLFSDRGSCHLSDL